MVLILIPTLLLNGGLVEARADTAVVFNEIMYHPATNEPAFEWIELHNQLAVDVDISDWSITGGLDYRFPSNTIVRGRGFLVLALSPGDLEAATGQTNILGPFTGRLSNNGELLELRNNSGRVVDELDYGVDGNWPVAPDGAGVSLAKADRDDASASAANWRASQQIGGTPGQDNFPFVDSNLPDEQLFAVESNWKYDATGTDRGTAWRARSYDDAAWSSGLSWFYLGLHTGGETRPIPTLFNTGVNANGAVLAPGASDPHYTITAAAQGPINTAAVVIENHPAWGANDSDSSWIGIATPGSQSVAAGGYNYRTRFTLSGFVPGTGQIALSLSVDNQCTNVLLNGVPTGISHAGFAGFSSPFSISSGLVPGTNTLEFRTTNDGTTANPHGFRALLSGTATFIITNTALAAGPSTYYFRKAFTFSGDPFHTALRLNVIADDGAVVYLNGVEVYRFNMPDGAVGYSTPAASAITTPAYTGWVTIPSTSLVAGTNILAVELHQAAGDTTDALFGAELAATPVPSQVASVAFNEIASGTNAGFWLEVANFGANPWPLDGAVLFRDGATNNEYVFPAATVLDPGQSLALTNTTLGFTPVTGDKLYLYGPGKATVYDAVVVKNRHRGRHPDGAGEWLYPSAPTPGATNRFAFRNEIVINEIMYHHHLNPATNNLPPTDNEEAWVELYNRGATPVDLTGWEFDNGISYRFTPGKTLAPGSFLVISDDALALRATYPGADIVGNYGGRLSYRSDRLVLRDPNGNPADEVRYFDGARWPGYADGGGSSLELRDPTADNSKAEAWDASDETGKSSWQSYTYRIVANIPSGSGQPTTWQDFILGLQDAGECLIDDLSVIESPATAPVQIIANGDFESGLAGWRVLGTHNRSVVEPEPGNPGNRVLHLIATGPQEHMHNHIERTLSSGRTISNGREYEVSFHARWLAGNNLLNTRLYFNRVGRTTILPVPPRNGTPGAQNSRHVANIGPTFSGLAHQKVVPAAGEPVTVSVEASDPQGVTSVRVFWSVNSGGWNDAPMSSSGNGRYAGTIPGQGAGAVVQFYVQATDGLGAIAMFPAKGPDSGALYKVDDGQAILSLAHNVRLILTPSTTDLMHGAAQGVNQTNVMSNDLLPCTVVYDEKRAYYDCGVHLRGSQRGRYSDTRTGFHIEFQPDDLFRGVHPVMLIDRSGQGDATENRQEEIVLKHILNRAGGIPGTYSEICRVLAPRSAHTGPAQFFPRHEDVFLETAFENGGDGTMFEMELIYYPTTANAAGYKLPQPDSVIGTDIRDLGDDKEIYRYNFMIKNHRDADDYRAFIALAKSWSLTGTALDAQTRQLMDIDQWMRAYALISLCSVGDMYTFGNNHNFFMYVRPSDGKFLYFPWDMDFAFSRGSSGALVGDQNLGKLVNLPGNLRRMYAHMLDIIGVSFNTAYMTYWTDHYDNFAPGQSYAGSLSTIGARAAFLTTAINNAGGNSPFAVNSPDVITTSSNLVLLTGTAPVRAATIKVNGQEYPITWGSVSAWTLQVPVTEPVNTLLVETFDLYGNSLTNMTRNLTVNYTGPAYDPVGAVVFNEIMYNPAYPDAAYVELFNNSPTASFDLSGWRINGLDFTFPSGTIIRNGQQMVLAGRAPTYVATYGTSGVLPSGEFAGNLQNDGETLTLLKPEAAPGEETEIDKVRYESLPPWPTSPNGTGPSLQLVDSRQDNSRVGNWTVSGGWQFYSARGRPGTILRLWLDSAGDLYIDDFQLVLGDVPAVGTNVIVNGDFELPFSNGWAFGGANLAVATNTDVSSVVAHSGTNSLHIAYTAPGGAGAHFFQNLSNIVANTDYTVSFWYLPSTSASNLSIYLASSFRPTVNVRPVMSTPGTANSVARILPEFPPLWLNEVQPENVSGITDNTGTRDPWIEIYNAGTNTVSLEGLFLSDTYTNLSKWAFPAGASIAPGEFKVVFADGGPGQTTGGEWHTSFRVTPAAGSVALAWTVEDAVEILDYLNYTNLPAGRSYGDYPDGQPFHRQEFVVATPGATNDNTAAPLAVFINEWMAVNNHTLLNTNNGNRYDDWFELYNPGSTSASLGGYYLTDNLSNRFQFVIPQGFVIPPHGFLLVWADSEPSLNNTNRPELHANFRLNQDGEQIGLFASDGSMIDGVTFEPQFADISQGRYLDASPEVYFLAGPTPSAPNSIWANRYPVLAPIPDADISLGQTLGFTAGADDPDAPPQTLSYSLDAGFPAGASVNPISGLFSWTPTDAQAPSTNLVTLRVTDNGAPRLSAARTFQVVVRREFRVTGIANLGGGQLGITFMTTVGKTYRMEFKNNLDDPGWTPLTADVVATSTSMTVPVSYTSPAQRFYRIVQVD